MTARVQWNSIAQAINRLWEIQLKNEGIHFWWRTGLFLLANSSTTPLARMRPVPLHGARNGVFAETRHEATV